MIKALFYGAIAAAVSLAIITASVRLSRGTPLAGAGNAVANLTGLNA